MFEGVNWPSNMAQGMSLDVSEGFSSFRQSKLECSSHESCVFRIWRRINNFYVFTFTVTQGTMVQFMIDSLALWLGYSQLIIRQSLSFLVMRMLITLSGWSRSLLLIGWAWCSWFLQSIELWTVGSLSHSYRW